MDLLSRCAVELSNAEELREQTVAVRSRVESEPHSPRVAVLYEKLRVLDHALAERARQMKQMSIGASQLAIGNTCDEELELEAELTSYLARKARNTSELLQRELAAPPTSGYEEPLG
jgi:hypothetical protein